MQICLCGTQAGYPHKNTCPRPLYNVLEDAKWQAEHDANTDINTEECPRCHRQVPLGEVMERHSAQVYTGKFCEQCAIEGYRDHCGIDRPMLTQVDLDEPLEPEEPNDLSILG